MSFKYLLQILLIILFCATSLWANTAQRLEEIKQKVDQYSTEYDSLISEQKGIEGKINKLSVSIENIKKEENSIAKLVDEVAAKEKKLNS